MEYQYTTAARRFALLIVIVGILTLLTRVYLRMEIPETFGDALSYLSQFFTILTNALTVVIMIIIASGRWVSPKVIKAVTIAICCVGIVYHAVLAHLLDLSGLALLADHGVHTFVPLLTVLWWFGFSPRAPLTVGEVITWVLWPIVYCVYILLRATQSGFYPYPFLNLPETGPVGLSINIFVLLIVFCVVGFALTGLKRVTDGLRATPLL